MKFELVFTDIANKILDELEQSKHNKGVYKAINKALALMEDNLRHSSLKTHKFDGIHGPKGEDVFESYAQNNTPGAYRIFWHYGPGKGKITILSITPHP